MCNLLWEPNLEGKFSPSSKKTHKTTNQKKSNQKTIKRKTQQKQTNNILKPQHKTGRAFKTEFPISYD